MKITQQLTGCVLLLAGCSLLSCQDTTNKDAGTIDVASALSSPAALKASDYFSQVRYVPLETTDESVIGPNPAIRLFGDRVIVTTRQKQCLLFDATTGRFIATLGRVGQGPEDNADVLNWINLPAQTVNIQAQNNSWQQYDNQGVYKGKIRLPIGQNTYIDAQSVVAFRDNLTSGAPDSLFFFRGEERTGAIATLPAGMERPPFSMADIQSMQVVQSQGFDWFGPVALGGWIYAELKGDDKVLSIFPAATRFWHLDDALYFKADFNDTIYQVRDMQLIPSRVFDLGAYHWPIEESFNKKFDKSIFITHILESNDLMLFRFTVRLYSQDDRKTYNALYNKRTGEVKLNLFGKGIEDNLTNFLPFQPYDVSPTGEYAGLLSATDVANWFADHPDRIASLPKEVQQLKQVGEEDNPVIVFLR